MGNPTPVSVSGDGNSYRYIRLRRTGNSAYGYSEIEVFADVTTQEVSRNRQAEVNFQTYASMGAKYTVDGKLTNSSQCWLIESLKSTSPNPPYNLVVDLEQDYPIGFIEMFGRYGVNASTYRNNWKIYGFTDAQGKPDANISDFSEAALLWSVTSAYPQITNGTNPEGLKAPITGNGKYRYVVFSKTKKELAAIGEIRAEVIIPEIASVERLSDTSLSVSFSEKMNAESLAEGITVVSDSGTVYTPSEVKLTDATAWDGGYDATVAFAESLPASGISLNVDGEVKTYAGATFVEDCQVRISGKTVEINKEYAETIENVNVALNKPVYAVPGNINCYASQGTNALIANGQAKIITSVPELITTLTGTTASKFVVTKKQITLEHQNILNMLKSDEVHFDDLVMESGLTVSQLSTLLTNMEMIGLIEKLPGNYFVAK